jgi:hypothetical protein
MEDYKRKKKSDKAKRNKELYGKYNPKHIRKYTDLVSKCNTEKIEFLSKTNKIVSNAKSS